MTSGVRQRAEDTRAALTLANTAMNERRLTGAGPVGPLWIASSFASSFSAAGCQETRSRRVSATACAVGRHCGAVPMPLSAPPLRRLEIKQNTRSQHKSEWKQPPVALTSRHARTGLINYWREPTFNASCREIGVNDSGRYFAASPTDRVNGHKSPRHHRATGGVTRSDCFRSET